MVTALTSDAKKGLLTLDRSKSGTRRAFIHNRSCIVENTDCLKLRIAMDVTLYTLEHE